ncbi:MAG: cob(I)yrinic acid a,c-diamide adenosyltransferase [Bacilli bacterium]
MKIYTKGGDQGATSLFDGTRVSKSDLRVDCYGTIDELEAVLGLSKNYLSQTEMIQEVIALQHQLFKVMSNLALLDQSKIKHQVVPEDITNLENLIDKYSDRLSPLQDFIITGSNHGAGLLHLARTTCRKAERKLVLLNKTEEVNPDILIYLNRLSDLLYVMARYQESDPIPVLY